MSAAENEKDEMAARALSRLVDPALPEGLAARITARATALPQAGSAAPDPLATLDLDPPQATSNPPQATPPRARSRRRIYVGASIAATLLLSVVIIACLRSNSDKEPAVARRDVPLPTPPQDKVAPPQFVGAAPAKASPASEPRRKSLRSSVPAMIIPVPPTPSVELAAENLPGAASVAVAPAPEKPKYSHSGPQDVPANGSSRPVYGPPAPIGLGIAGAPGGRISGSGDSGSGGRVAKQ